MDLSIATSESCLFYNYNNKTIKTDLIKTMLQIYSENGGKRGGYVLGVWRNKKIVPFHSKK